MVQRGSRVRAVELAALGCVAFLPAALSGFVSDDFVLLHTLEESSGAGWAFNHNDLGQPGDAGHFYRPLWVLWNAGIFRAFGESALAFHVANLVLYAVVVVETWLLLRRLVGGN